MSIHQTAVNLPDFLLARIAEDEAANDELVRDEVARCRADGMSSLTEDEVRAYWSGQPWWKRRLAECDAKRRIVAAELLREVGPVSHYISAEIHAAITERTTTPVLRLLALPYADHPEYDEAWRP